MEKRIINREMDLGDFGGPVEIKYYRCWKCGNTTSKTYGVTCASNVCGGSVIIEISEELYKLLDTWEKSRKPSPL